MGQEIKPHIDNAGQTNHPQTEVVCISRQPACASQHGQSRDTRENERKTAADIKRGDQQKTRTASRHDDPVSLSFEGGQQECEANEEQPKITHGECPEPAPAPRSDNTALVSRHRQADHFPTRQNGHHRVGHLMEEDDENFERGGDRHLPKCKNKGEDKRQLPMAPQQCDALSGQPF